MIFFVIIDQNTGTQWNIDGIEKDALKEMTKAHLLFFRELGFSGLLKNLKVIWAHNWDSQKDAEYYQERLVNRWIDDGNFIIAANQEHLASLITPNDSVYIIGGNATGCILNETLQYNYHWLSSLTKNCWVVIDLCYDSTTPGKDAREIYSFIASEYAYKSIRFTDTYSLKRELIKTI
jgi:hypothetical protein